MEVRAITFGVYFSQGKYYPYIRKRKGGRRSEKFESITLGAYDLETEARLALAIGKAEFLSLLEGEETLQAYCYRTSVMGGLLEDIEYQF